MPENNLIFKSLAAINKEITAIGKDKKNNEQGGFKYRGIDDVYNELHSLFAKHDVVICPRVLSIDHIEGQTSTGKVVHTKHIRVRYDFFASDGSSTFTELFGEGADMADKATAKALSQAMKNMLMEMFLIPTEDLVDGDSTTPEPTRPMSKEPPKQLFSRALYDKTVATAEEKAVGDPKAFGEAMAAIWAKVVILHNNKEVSDELFAELDFIHKGKIAGLV